MVKPETLIHEDSVFKGIISGVLAFFLLAVMSMFVRLLGPDHHVMEIAFYRNLVPMIMIFVYIIAANKRHELKTGKPLALLFRVLFGTVGLFLTFATIKSMRPSSSASDSVTRVGCSPTAIF